MSSTVLAMAPYEPAICDCLDLGPRAYCGTPKGTPVIGELFFMRTSGASRELAEALHINMDNGECLFFTQTQARKLAEDAAVVERLRQLCEVAGNPGDEEHFCRLARIPGTMFFFRPNG